MNESRGAASAKPVGQSLIAQRLRDRLKAIEKFERSSMGRRSSSNDSLHTVEDNELNCSGLELDHKLNLSGSSSRHKSGSGRGRNRQGKRGNEDFAPPGKSSSHRRTRDQVQGQYCYSFYAKSDDKFLPSSSSSDDEFSSEPFSISRGRGRGKLISSNSDYAAAQNDSSSDSYYSKKSYSRRKHQSFMHNFNVVHRPTPSLGIHMPSVDSRFEESHDDNPRLISKDSSSHNYQDLKEFSPSEDEKHSTQRSKSFKIRERIEEFDDDFFPSDHEKTGFNNVLKNTKKAYNFSSSADEQCSSISSLKVQKKVDEFDDFFPSNDEGPISAPNQKVKSVKTRETVDEFDDFFPSDDEKPISIPDQKMNSLKVREKIDEFEDFFPSDDEESSSTEMIQSAKMNNKANDGDNAHYQGTKESLPDKRNTLINERRNDYNLFLSSEENATSDENRNGQHLEAFSPSEDEQSSDKSSSKPSSSVQREDTNDRVTSAPLRGCVLRPYNRQSRVESVAYFSQEEKEEMKKRIQKLKSSSKQESVITPVNGNGPEDESISAKGDTFISKNKDHLPYGLQITHLNFGEFFQGKDSILLQNRNSFAGIATAMVAILNSSQPFGRILDGIYGSIIRGNHLTRGRRDVYRRDFDALVRNKIKPRILPGLYTIHFIPIYEGRNVKDEFYVVEIFVDKSGSTEPESAIFEVEKEGRFIWENNVIKKIVS